MNRPFAALFDMDGVLVDNHEFHFRAWTIFCEKHHLPVSREKFLKVFGGSSRENLEGFFGRKLSESEITEYSEEKENIYRQIYKPFLKPVEGLRELLTKLRSLRIDMAIATSAPLENAEFVIQEASLKGYFRAIVHDRIIVNNKPHPEVYLKAAELLGYKPNRCIAFEDSVKGIESAKGAGMKVVGVATTNPPEMIRHTDLVIDNFTQLEPEQLYTLLYQ
jgi:beta-phosphoglucomutase